MFIIDNSVEPTAQKRRTVQKLGGGGWLVGGLLEEGNREGCRMSGCEEEGNGGGRAGWSCWS